jgi:hypothetical protein
MKTINLNAYVISFAVLISLVSCNDDAENPDVIQLLINSSVESGAQSPNKWFAQSGDHHVEWSSDHAFTGSRSLMISSDDSGGDFGYWGQTVRTDIPYGRRLRLSSMVKLDNVETDDYGVSLVIRGDDESSSVFFYTTQGDVPIHGNQDWTKYSIDMKSAIPESVETLLVFLVLSGNAKGAVYFDDITLETIN